MDKDEALREAADQPLTNIDRLRMHAHDPDTFEAPDPEDLLSEIDALAVESEVGREMIALVRDLAKEVTGGNCTFVDQDARKLAELAKGTNTQAMREALEAVRQACLFDDDDGIGVTLEPVLTSEQFNAICAALKPAQADIDMDPADLDRSVRIAAVSFASDHGPLHDALNGDFDAQDRVAERLRTKLKEEGLHVVAIPAQQDQALAAPAPGGVEDEQIDRDRLRNEIWECLETSRALYSRRRYLDADEVDNMKRIEAIQGEWDRVETIFTHKSIMEVEK